MELPTQKLIFIFEAVNESLQEAFVGATSLPLAAVERRHRFARPAAIAHWRPEHHVLYRRVESGLSAKESAAFIPAYARAAHAGWKTFVDHLQ